MRSLVISKSAKRKIKVFIRKHPTLRSKLEQVITNLLRDPFLATLETHRLSGRLKYLYAASISYDYRVVFFFDDKFLYLVNIGSHEEVYWYLYKVHDVRLFTRWLQARQIVCFAFRSMWATIIFCWKFFSPGLAPSRSGFTKTSHVFVTPPGVEPGFQAWKACVLTDRRWGPDFIKRSFYKIAGPRPRFCESGRDLLHNTTIFLAIFQ